MRLFYSEDRDGQRVIASAEITPREGTTAAEMLVIKAASHASHGWEVVWLNDHSFTATKLRWQAVLVARHHYLQE